MRFTWEVEDITPGRRVKVPACNETWMIGYSAMEGNNRYCLISLADGMVNVPGSSKSDLVSTLNTGYEPLSLPEAK